MPIYISMLRGINVGGHKRVKMDDLRKSCEGLGFEQVKTYIQSGNIVFKAGKASPLALAKKIEARIVSDFGFSASVIVRTGAELGETIAANPFLKQHGIDQEKLHVTFLSGTPATPALKKLAEFTVAPDRSQCVGKDIFLYLPNGFSASSLWKVPWEKALGVVTTTRNWKTVNALHQMCGDCE
ncbi:MAG TPA: DUF1697 domain-containing protein [Candidatus Sulfotelmatobacter sp.]|jgi:uncharacterized protein (DUF1697 family)|nr:DUF1697 domain-containing protein [Candidatus Sulfotelmatobacter sp.]